MSTEYIYLLEQYHLSAESTFIGVIDGRKSKTLDGFKQEAKNAFQFPDYFSDNMNSFHEIINDLSWLNKSDYLMIITFSDEFMKSETESERQYLKNFLSEVSEEWNNVPNYQGEDEYRKKSRFIVHYM
jgi:hypothetical protein